VHGYLARAAPVRATAVTAAAPAGWALAPHAAGAPPGHPHGDWGSVYRSVDGGRLWQDLNRYYPVGTVYDVSAPNPGRIWEATDRGLLRTDDMGRTWRPVGPRALGERVTLVSEHPTDGSVLVGGPDGLFRAAAGLALWQRVLPRSAGEPVSLTRDGDRVLVATAGGWQHSDDGGAGFEPGTAGLAPVGGRLVRAAEAPSGPPRVISRAVAGRVTVAGTLDGAYVSNGGDYRLLPGTEGLAIWVALAAPRLSAGSFLLGTSRGLLAFDPRRPGQVRPVEDIPPFLAVGALEVPVSRPDELFMATSVRPYPAPKLPSPTSASGGSAWPWSLPAAAVVVGGAWWWRVRRRRR
jgi:hypothetical protein